MDTTLHGARFDCKHRCLVNCRGRIGDDTKMTQRQIGVGPHPKPWPNDPKYDPYLLQTGDTRNVADRYRYWTNEAIVADLDTHRFTLEVAIENVEHDFNIGTVVRNANAFNVRTVYIIGRHHWNRRGAMVTDAYLHIVYYQTADEFIAAMHANKKTIIAVDNIPGATGLSRAKLPKQSVLVFGAEGPGLSREMVQAGDMTVAIEQFGSTRSVNVGVASGIVMYAWLQQHVMHLVQGD